MIHAAIRASPAARPVTNPGNATNTTMKPVAYLDQTMPSEQPKRLAIELPKGERGRHAVDLKALDKINRDLASLTGKFDKGSEDRRKDLLAKREALEGRPGLADEQAWRAQAHAETAALAQGRGEEVDQSQSGICRVMERDPLLSLARAGHLTPERLDIGLEVRELYDSRAQDAGTAQITGMPSGAHDHEKFVAARFTRAKASARIGRIERAIAINCSAEPACLTMLRVICERGMSATSQGKGRAFERNVGAFARALDIADDVLRRRI